MTKLFPKSYRGKGEAPHCAQISLKPLGQMLIAQHVDAANISLNALHMLENRKRHTDTRVWLLLGTVDTLIIDVKWKNSPN